MFKCEDFQHFFTFTDAFQFTRNQSFFFWKPPHLQKYTSLLKYIENKFLAWQELKSKCSTKCIPYFLFGF